MKLGRPSKNTKRRDPRYFLNEQQEQSEQEFLDLFTKVGNEISDEELLGLLSEVEEKVPAERGQKQELYISEEVKKYMINFIRKRIVDVGSFKLRVILKTATASTFGGALAALFAVGYGPRKLWRITSTKYLDKKIEQTLSSLYPRGKEVLYPGETDIKTLIKATFQSVWRSLKSDAEQKVKALPEPERKELEQEIEKQLEELAGHPVEIDSGAVPEEPPEQEQSSGWDSWDEKRTDPDRYANDPRLQKLVKKVQGGK
tara:strand:- start:1607 stop:2380 length:774 start_codon:yes stop_codon:yes gene_type:complete